MDGLNTSYRRRTDNGHAGGSHAQLLTTFSVSCLKFGMNNILSTASMEDCPSFKSRSSKATSAAVRCWASNGHKMQWNGQKEKTQKWDRHWDRKANPHALIHLCRESTTALERTITPHWSPCNLNKQLSTHQGNISVGICTTAIATARAVHVGYCQTCNNPAGFDPSIR